MNADHGAESPAERVCVVIWDGSAPEAELRRYLGDVLPLRFVRWQDRAYLAAIEQLRPSVIVAVEPDDELASDVAALLACLVTAYTPTILGMTLPPRAPSPRRSRAAESATPTATGAPAEVRRASGASVRPRLLVRQLGACEGARITSLADIIFG